MLLWHKHSDVVVINKILPVLAHFEIIFNSSSSYEKNIDYMYVSKLLNRVAEFAIIVLDFRIFLYKLQWTLHG